MQPISTPLTSVRIVEPASEDSCSSRHGSVDQDSLDIENQLEGHHPRKLSYWAVTVAALLLKLWRSLRQQAHHLNVHFRVPETETLFTLYSFRWQTPIMLYATVYIFIIAALLSAIVLYFVEYTHGVLSGAITINECWNRRHCFQLMMYFFLSVLPSLMALIFVIVAIKSKRQNCFVKLLRIGSIVSAVLLTSGATQIFDNMASNIVALIVIPLWLGMVIPLMELIWIPLFTVGTTLVLVNVAIYQAVGGQDLWSRVSVNNMCLCVCLHVVYVKCYVCEKERESCMCCWIHSV